MVWSGQFVHDELSVELTKKDNILDIHLLVGMALRINPKRAHLLVSTVLGKHIPADPKLIIASSEILAVMVEEKLTGQDHTSSDFLRGLLSQVLKGELPVSTLVNQLAEVSLKSEAKVVGYAETATSLGAGVARKLNAYYIHSTRYPDSDALEYGVFEESHSHATSHKLTPQDFSELDSAAPIVLVDDELSTGNTVMNTIKALQLKSFHKTYVVASLVDLRSDSDRTKIEEFADRMGIELHFVALASGQVTLPSNVLLKAQEIIATTSWSKSDPSSIQGLGQLIEVETAGLPIVSLKNGFKDLGAYSALAKRIASQLPAFHEREVLVLGLEEDMFLPLLIAGELFGNISFSTTTRSPVLSYDSSAYAIKEKLSFQVEAEEGDTPDRYAYNIGNQWDDILIISNEGKLGEEKNIKNLIEQLRKRSERVFLMTASKLAEPLAGPEFGSYKAEDVKWLLKNLSEYSLEAPTEDREEAIQSGGAHYAESLPIEFQPSSEYQELFKLALKENSVRLAEAVATVSELIMRKRNGTPVLVSLARAGTPVGVLIKKYINEVHKVTVPHYAVSIVRGKGIDYNALKYLASNYDEENVIFVDGWTGKGAIVKELRIAIDKYNNENSTNFSADVAVLADPGRCVDIYGTRDDYLIPSACLNSTVSGLISRTVLNESFIGPYDYHGAKFYEEFKSNDFSNFFVDQVAAEFEKVKGLVEDNLTEYFAGHSAPDFAGWEAVEEISERYSINNINLVKPGVGETTRVLLRRVPWRILIREDKMSELTHIRLLAEERGVEIVSVKNLPYSCVGLIHPEFTKAATGFSGVKE